LHRSGNLRRLLFWVSAPCACKEAEEESCSLELARCSAVLLICPMMSVQLLYEEIQTSSQLADLVVAFLIGACGQIILFRHLLKPLGESVQRHSDTSDYSGGYHQQQHQGNATHE